MATFDGLSVALSGLTAQRRLLDVAGQNVANANTEGYSRQRVLLTSVGGPTVPGIWSGSAFTGGVRADGVDRLRDALLEVRGQQAHSVLQDLSATSTVLGQVEQLFPEPSDDGLSAQLSSLWSAFHDLANQPGDLGTRSALLQRAGAVADWLGGAAAELSTLSDATTSQARGLVDEVNGLARQVAGLNDAIARGSDAGLPVNELSDQRDLLALQLADLVGGVSTAAPDGSLRISVGGAALVEGATARPLALAGAGTGLGLVWPDGTAAQPSGGELRGMVDAVRTAIPAWTARLDTVAAQLATQVNGLHTTGFDLDGLAGGAFFTGTTAATLRVALTDPRRVAASGVAPGPGGPSLDTGVANALAGIGASATGPDAVYTSLVTDLGLTVQGLQRRVGTQETVTTGIDRARESHSGVDIDEEMASIVVFQRAYEASSRVLTSVDQALDTLINRTGLVGRA